MFTRKGVLGAASVMVLGVCAATTAFGGPVAGGGIPNLSALSVPSFGGLRVHGSLNHTTASSFGSLANSPSGAPWGRGSSAEAWGAGGSTMSDPPGAVGGHTSNLPKQLSLGVDQLENQFAGEFGLGRSGGNTGGQNGNSGSGQGNGSGQGGQGGNQNGNSGGGQGGQGGGGKGGHNSGS